MKTVCCVLLFWWTPTIPWYSKLWHIYFSVAVNTTFHYRVRYLFLNLLLISLLFLFLILNFLNVSGILSCWINLMEIWLKQIAELFLFIHRIHQFLNPRLMYSKLTQFIADRKHSRTMISLHSNSLWECDQAQTFIMISRFCWIHKNPTNWWSISWWWLR